MNHENDKVVIDIELLDMIEVVGVQTIIIVIIHITFALSLGRASSCLSSIGYFNIHRRITFRP